MIASVYPYHYNEFGYKDNPYDKILALSTLKAFADNKFIVVKIMIFVSDRVENNVDKGENAIFKSPLFHG